jgi:lactate dehydrogenase-like 2-hydroxyacid dehydrogenase
VLVLNPVVCCDVVTLVTPVRKVVSVVTVETTVTVDVAETTVGDALSIVERAVTIVPGTEND